MIDRADLKARAKQAMSGNMGMLIVCMLIVTAITFVCGIIPYLGTILLWCVSGSLGLGMAYIYLNLVKGQEPDVNILFSGFQRFVDALVLTLLIGIFTFLWSLLLIVPGIIKAISYSQAYYILAEHPEMTGKEALDASVDMMDGHKMDYFVLCLSFIPWLLLVSVTCGLAILYVEPYMQATFVNFYHAIKGPEMNNMGGYGPMNGNGPMNNGYGPVNNGYGPMNGNGSMNNGYGPANNGYGSMNGNNSMNNGYGSVNNGYDPMGGNGNNAMDGGNGPIDGSVQ